MTTQSRRGHELSPTAAALGQDPGGGASIDRSFPLPAAPASTPAARSIVRSTLPGTGYADHVEAAELLVSELVTNALLHGGTDIWLRLFSSPAMLRVEVSDDGDAQPRLPDHDPNPEQDSGRGLFIVAHLASRWGVEHGPGATVAWFELDAG